MSTTTPTTPTTPASPGNGDIEEEEIHDLVLLFANSKFPRGSDAFQTLVGDFLKRDTPDSTADAHMVSSDSSNSSVKDEEVNINVTQPPKSALKSSGKSVRMMSPKPLAHVHWPDDSVPKIPNDTVSEPTHHARLFMKTTPKPILKHDEHVMVRSANSRHRRRMKTPTL
ncbi:hypothetical protein ACF0H5_005250 [Mactra antiquata]